MANSEDTVRERARQAGGGVVVATSRSQAKLAHYVDLEDQKSLCGRDASTWRVVESKEELSKYDSCHPCGSHNTDHEVRRWVTVAELADAARRSRNEGEDDEGV